MVGGYGQFTYHFNYWGPTGCNRDTHVYVRKLPELSGSHPEGTRTRGWTSGSQISMVFHLDKCIGCHTCSIACKNVWTDRKGTEYMWWNNVETKPGTGYPTKWEDQDEYRGGWEVKDGGIELKSTGRGRIDPQHLPQPVAAQPRRLLRALDLQVPGPLQRARGRRPADGASDLDDHGQVPIDDRGGTQLGRRPRRLAGLRRERSEPRGADPRGAAPPALRRSSGSCSSTCRASATTASIRAASRRALRRPLQARRGRHRADQPGASAAPGVPASRRAPTRRPTSTGQTGKARSASSASRASRRGRPRPASTPAWAGSATSACSLRRGAHRGGRRAPDPRRWSTPSAT